VLPFSADLHQDFHYVQLPIRASEDLVGIDGERLEEMLVYPELEKEPDLSPYPYLVERFRTALRWATVLVVVGYRFGDVSLVRILEEELSSNPQLQVLVVDPEPKDALLGKWPRHRWMQMSQGFRDAMITEELRDRVQALLTAQEHAVAARNALPMRPEAARVEFTQAVSELVRIGHIAGAYWMVNEATEAIPSPPHGVREILVSDWHEWLANLPDVTEPEARAWWDVGRWHLTGAEHGSLSRIAASTTAEARVRVAPRSWSIRRALRSPVAEDMSPRTRRTDGTDLQRARQPHRLVMRRYHFL
jgi:hypothetical protein